MQLCVVVLAILVGIISNFFYLYMNSPAPPFLIIDRINESELTYDVFRDRYLTQAVPLIIVHDSASPALVKNSGTGARIKESLLANCGSRKVDLISNMVKRFVTDLSPVLSQFLSSGMLRFNRESLSNWKANRLQIPLDQFASSESLTGSLQLAGITLRPAKSRLRKQLERLLLPSLLQTLLVHVSRPPYLADVKPEFVCPAALLKVKPGEIREFEEEDVFEFMRHSNVEKWTADELLRRGGETGVYSLGEWAPKGPHDLGGGGGNEHAHWKLRSPDKIFWGGPGSSSYPLHRDEKDADAFFTMWSGCKEFIIVAPAERHLLHRFDVPGFNIWHDDLFKYGNVGGIKLGWRATVEEGETLYMPGELIHAVHVRCFDTMNVCRRPWRATAVRNIGAAVDEIMGEIAEEAVEKRSWILYGGIKKVASAAQFMWFIKNGGLREMFQP